MLGFSAKSQPNDFHKSSLSNLSISNRPTLSARRLRTNHIYTIRHEIRDQVAVRHAHSTHNELGIFNGSPANKNKYGLTNKGVAEVIGLIPHLQSWVEESGKNLLIVHSDFRRAREMAELIVGKLGNDLAMREERSELRERDPGRLEGLPYRDILARFGVVAREDESAHKSRSNLKKAMSLIHRSNLLAIPSKQILRLEPVREVEARTTRLIRELYDRQLQHRQLVLYIGHEFSLGPALNAFLGRPAGMFWSNRHIPRACPFELSVNTAQRHFYQETNIQPISQRKNT